VCGSGGLASSSSLLIRRQNMPAVRPRFHLAPCSKFRSHLYERRPFASCASLPCQNNRGYGTLPIPACLSKSFAFARRWNCIGCGHNSAGETKLFPASFLGRRPDLFSGGIDAEMFKLFALNVEPAVGPCHFQLCLIVAELAGKPGTTLLQSSVLSPLIAFLKAGTGIPAILSFTEPRKFQLVKYSVFQSGPPNAMFVVRLAMDVPSELLAPGMSIQRTLEPPQYTFPALSTCMPSGTPGERNRVRSSSSLASDRVSLKRTSASARFVSNSEITPSSAS
jgi:hypothetical protein